MSALPQLRIDWFRVISDLERAGLTQEEIGGLVGRSTTQINAYKSIPDTEPRFHVGALLLALWQERTGRHDWPRAKDSGNRRR